MGRQAQLRRAVHTHSLNPPPLSADCGAWGLLGPTSQPPDRSLCRRAGAAGGRTSLQRWQMPRQIIQGGLWGKGGEEGGCICTSKGLAPVPHSGDLGLF